MWGSFHPSYTCMLPSFIHSCKHHDELSQKNLQHCDWLQIVHTSVCEEQAKFSASHHLYYCILLEFQLAVPMAEAVVGLPVYWHVQ